LVFIIEGTETNKLIITPREIVIKSTRANELSNFPQNLFNPSSQDYQKSKQKCQAPLFTFHAIPDPDKLVKIRSLFTNNFNINFEKRKNGARTCIFKSVRYNYI
ncbi:MAG: hypothetical protein XE03_1929, partial [candidate division TA06 bacterium 34_109]